MPSPSYIASLRTEREALAARPDSPAKRRRVAAVQEELSRNGVEFEDTADHAPIEYAVTAKRGPGRPRKETI